MPWVFPRVDSFCEYTPNRFWFYCSEMLISSAWLETIVITVVNLLSVHEKFSIS
jgi:hypothetical protein